MAHELTIRDNGTAEMAYVGETPWHGLGEKLEEGAPLEVWQKAAGMDWMIQTSPVLYAPARGAEPLQHDSAMVTYRSDNKDPLGIVSRDYRAVQPRDVLAFFADVADATNVQLHTAGTLYGGKKFWALARAGAGVLPGGDEVGAYLLLSTSADGSSATEVRETSVRVVCNNTLTLATSGSGNRMRINHRQQFNARNVRLHFLSMSETWGSFFQAAEALTKLRVGALEAERFVHGILLPTLHEDEGSQRRPKGLDKILSLFDGEGRGSDLPSSKGTLWGLVNAVTEYVDHHATAQTTSHRLDRAWYGAGDELKTRAFQTAVALI